MDIEDIKQRLKKKPCLVSSILIWILNGLEKANKKLNCRERNND